MGQMLAIVSGKGQVPAARLAPERHEGSNGPEEAAARDEDQV